MNYVLLNVSMTLGKTLLCANFGIFEYKNIKGVTFSPIEVISGHINSPVLYFKVSITEQMLKRPIPSAFGKHTHSF